MVCRSLIQMMDNAPPADGLRAADQVPEAERVDVYSEAS